MLTLCRLIAIVAVCAQAFAQGQDMTDAEWNRLDALYAHFGELSDWQHEDWFTSSDPCEWKNIECNDQGKMELHIWILRPNELRASRPVTHALENVDRLILEFEYRDYPELDFAYIARLFPNLEELTIRCWWNVKSFANLGALTQMPLEQFNAYGIGQPFPLAEWLPRMTHLRELRLSDLVLPGEHPELDLRGLIPPKLEKLWIDLPTNHPKVHRALLSDDLIAAREQPDGSVTHPLSLNFNPSFKFLSFEMECRTLDPRRRPIESRRKRPQSYGKHPLTLLYGRYEPAPDIDGRPISKFAVLAIA